MSDYTHQCPSATDHTFTPDAVAQEFNRQAIDVNSQDLNDQMDNEAPDSSVSDCISVVSTDQSGSALLPFIGSGLMDLGQKDKVYSYIKEKFLSRLSAVGAQVTLAAIHRNCRSSFSAKERAQAFEAYSEAVQKKGGSDTANVKYAFYVTSREEVPKIFSDGFECSGKPGNNGLYGCGVYFAPLNHPLESIRAAPIDKDGLQHLLICRVILGKSELIHRGSEQSHPSSEQYDSGIDNLISPRRYIVWSSHMNTHVLPEYVISFRAACSLRGSLKPWNPNAPWIPFKFFITQVSKIFPATDVSLISKYYKDHKEGNISRHETVQKVRQIVGDKILHQILKSFRLKYYGA